MPNDDEQNLITQNEFKNLWDKWNDFEIIDGITEQLAVKNVFPIQNIILDLINRNEDSGTFNEKEAFEWGEKTASAMAHLIKGSFIVGIDYGSKEKEIDDKKIVALAQEALPVIQVARKPIDTLLLYLIANSVSKNLLLRSIAQKRAEEAGNHVAQAALQSFKLGVQYSKNENVAYYLTIQNIINRWSRIQPPADIELKVLESKNIVYKILDLIDLSILGQEDYRIKSAYIQSQTRIRMSKIIKLSFLIGLEYSSHPNIKESHSEALDLFKLVVSPIYGLAVKAMNTGGESSMTDENKKKLLDDLYSILIVLASECYSMGLKYKSV